MSGEPDNLIFQYLRRMDAKLDRLIEDVQNLKVRMTAVEEGMAALNRRVDRIEDRLDKIETRPDLVETPH